MVAYLLYAFLRLGLEYIWAGQAYPGLLKWIQKLEVLGCVTDGIFPGEFRHGIYVSDVVRTSIVKERFFNLYEARSGSLWPGEDKARKMIAELRKNESLAERISTVIRSMHAEHDQLIEKIERYAK